MPVVSVLSRAPLVGILSRMLVVSILSRTPVVSVLFGVPVVSVLPGTPVVSVLSRVPVASVLSRVSRHLLLLPGRSHTTIQRSWIGIKSANKSPLSLIFLRYLAIETDSCQEQ